MSSQPSFHFTHLRSSNPELSDSALLNSNNRTPFTADADVVVAGAGILGLCYAIQLKKFSPNLRIAVFEKSPAPVQKIGESTLSSFTKFTDGVVLPSEYLLRLFGLKDGLQFYCVDTEGREVTSEDIGSLDLSFQLDRRISELFFTMWAQKQGINVYHGVDVDFDIKGTACLLSDATDFVLPPQVILKNYPHPNAGTHVTSRLVCDASGFARKLTGKFGKKEVFDGWNCDAYWAYFRPKGLGLAEDRLSHWDHAATRHICFPEGWGWFINLISWHHAPLSNLMDLLTHIIDNASAGIPATEIPSARELSVTFNCPFEPITSIGWAVRNDHRYPDSLDAYGSTDTEQKFNYYQRRYPTLDRLMNDAYELLPNYYGRTYFARKAMAYRSPIVAGDGWFAIGNSAGFTNPLISPGINAGIGTSVLAATLSSSILASPKDQPATVALMRKSAAEYQAYSHDFMIPRLHLMNRFWYNMFRDHRLFDALVRCMWILGIEEIDTQYQRVFSEEDIMWVVGAGRDGFVLFAGKVLQVLEVDNEGRGPPSERAVKLVLELSRQLMKEYTERWPANTWSRFMRKYDDKLQRVPGKTEREPGGKFLAVRCGGPRCRVWIHDKMEVCPICGLKRSVVLPSVSMARSITF